MKKIIYLLLTIPFFLASCSKEDMAQGEETVQISFKAEIPQVHGTRSTTADLNVDNVVCAVFENGVEITSLRQTVAINGGNIVYSPRLVKGRTYDVVFWAMKDDNYDVTNMTAISRNANGSTNEADYDAFTATTSVTVQNSMTAPIELTRPLAQLNIGITEEDWEAVTNIFGQTPEVTTITFQAKNQFNALSGATTGQVIDITQTSSAFDDPLSVNGTDYKHLGMYYVLLAELEETTIDLIYTITDNNGIEIRSDVQIPFVPVQRNYKTNIVGGLLTGTIEYEITFGNEFNNEEHNGNI